jgi:two-component system KDP operon response regulator KdpE
MWAENGRNGETAIILSLPADPMTPRAVETRVAPAEVSTAAELPLRGGARAPERGLSTVMMVQGNSSLMRTLASKLEEQDYDIITYNSGDEAIRDLNLNLTKFDLIVLDLSLRGEDSLDVCRRMRVYTAVPVVYIADKISDRERAEVFNVGADDYIVKPISNEELMGRVQAIFKRGQIVDRTREPQMIGDLYIDFARREVFLNNKPVELTRIEYDLLHTLITNRGQVLTHRQLLEKVWGPEYQDATQYLWVNISRLRKKLKSSDGSMRYIHNQPGIGYMFSEF